MGLSSMDLNLQMARGARRTGAAFDSALPPVPRAIEPFPSNGRAIARRGPGDVGTRLEGSTRPALPKAARLWPAAVQERSVPRPPLRHRIVRRGRLKQRPKRRRRGENERAPPKGSPATRN